jgi:uncharacterized protein DUF499
MSLRVIFDSCEPRDEVLRGDLRDEMFAARLRDVMEDRADPVYQEAKRFFDNTFPTEGLRTLVRETLGRLSGREPANSPFVRLETSFGGGKTHNLIALYHLAQGRTEGVPPDLVPREWIPTRPWPTVGIVGSDMDPANGVDHGDVKTRTLWGEMAYQLGRLEGYDLLRKSDEDLVAPGTGVLEKLVGGRPALIMLDELARYLRSAKAVATSNRRSDLAEQTVAFLMTLIEFAASRKKVVVVITLADSKDAFAEETETLRMELAEARRVSARQERVITPTGEAEIARIVNHRLFRRVDQRAAEEVAAAYTAYLSKLAEQEPEIPQRVTRAEYASTIVQDYPFHPEFLAALTLKTATIPNFQKTRGALRLLARVVRELWDRRPADAWLICGHHVDLGMDDVANDLTSRLERPQFRQVIEADIISSRSGTVAHAQAVDRRWTEAGKPPYARRAATTIFLHSLTQGIATGVDPAELAVSVLQPGDDPQLLRKALALMLGEEKGDPGTACWFLHWDGHRYSFKTEPSLEKVIQDELAMVGRVKAKTELDDRIRHVWKKAMFQPVYFPSEAVDVDDDAREPKLAVIHYDADAASVTSRVPPDLVTKLFDHTGGQESYRTFKNNLLFLVADQDQVDRMVDVVQRYLAIKRIASDPDRIREFTDEQRKKLRGMQDAAELDVRVSITRAYRHLYYPSADAPKSAGGLAHEVLPPQEQGDIEKDQSAAVLRVLRQLQKVLTADDPAMPAAYVKAKAWPHGQVSMTTEDLRREFAKRIGLKILLDVTQLRRTVRTGIEQGTWVYFDAQEQAGYGKPSPAPLVQFSEDAVLYTPPEAERLGVRIKGVEQISQECPLCRRAPCVCGEDPSPGPVQQRLRAQADGPPAQAFQSIADQFHDAGASKIARLVIRCEGVGKDGAADSRALGLAIPQLGKGAYHLDHTMGAEFGAGADAEKFSLTFSGAWDRYKRVKQLTDPFGQEASNVNVRTILRASWEGGLDVGSEQFQGMRDVFASLGIGKIAIEAEQAAGAPEPS